MIVLLFVHLFVGSDMEEGAFTAILGKSIQMHPGFKVAHVPPQLLCSWAMFEENAADEAMHSWCLQYRTSLLDSASYIAFHWGQGHYCSLVLCLDVWRAGPSNGVSASSASGAAAAAAAAAAGAASASSPSSKRRKTARNKKAQMELSLLDTAVPFLHLDTLASHCQLSVVGTLLSICRVFNRLCGTTWPEEASYWTSSQVHLCGPPAQKDEWSCGYHLLRAWSHNFHAKVESWTPAKLTQICAPMAETPLQQFVQEIAAEYKDSEVSIWH
jgi:hypothetical protein